MENWSPSSNNDLPGYPRPAPGMLRFLLPRGKYSMFERLPTTFVDAYSRPPRLDPSGGSVDAKDFPATAAAGITGACPKSPRRERRGGGRRSPSGSPGHAHARSSPASSSHPRSRTASSNSPRSPTAVSPRHKLDPEIVGGGSPSARAAATRRRGQVTHAGGAWAAVAEQRSRRGKASPERTAGGVEESATRQLKDSSSFWLVRGTGMFDYT